MSNNVSLKYDSTQFGVNSSGQLYILASALGKLPSGTTSVRLALAADVGQLFFDTDFKKAFVYTGAVWKSLVSTLVESAVFVNNLPLDGSIEQSLTAPGVSVSVLVS